MGKTNSRRGSVMADFCRQCCIDHYGVDYRDLANLGASQNPPKVLDDNEGWAAMCEGCGFILVNEQGECIDCDLKSGEYGHGPLRDFNS